MSFHKLIDMTWTLTSKCNQLLVNHTLQYIIHALLSHLASISSLRKENLILFERETFGWDERESVEVRVGRGKAVDSQSAAYIQAWHMKTHCVKFDTDAKWHAQGFRNNLCLGLFHTRHVTSEDVEYSAWVIWTTTYRCLNFDSTISDSLCKEEAASTFSRVSWPTLHSFRGGV